MKPNALDTALDRIVDHDEWVTPFDPRFRHSMVVATLGLVTSLIMCLLLRQVQTLTTPYYFFGLAPALAAYLELVAHLRPVILVSDLLGLGLLVPLYRATNNLMFGSGRWHKLALAVAVIGAINLAIWSVWLIPALVVVILSVIVLVVGVILTILAFFIVLAAVGLASSGR